jgi:peptidoglycan/LPS O-acetylase OafA/YrhL
MDQDMALVTSVQVRSGATGLADRRRAFRGDVQGLRGLAVVLVLLYHAGVPFLPGGFVGVDVFFVISGFLITGLIVREIDRTGRLSLARFYARRARRLLPAATLVLVFVAGMTLTVLPVTRWHAVSSDLAASSLEVVNWTLAARSVDYLAQGAATSPLQHFWSLAVEEQFYIVWPVLIVLVLWVLQRVGGQPPVSRRRLAVALLAIAVPSMTWSWYLTAQRPGPAYFVSTTRIWELAIGALLAIGADRLARVPQYVRLLIGWLGLAAIVLAAWQFDATTPFPSLTALLPTLGAAAVISAGLGAGRGLALLRAPALQDVGDLSYSLYLWHWPLLVAAAVVWGDDNGHLWLPTALIVVGFAAVPAWLANRVIERPLHMSSFLAARPLRTAFVAGICIVLGVASAGVVSWRLDQVRSESSRGALGGATATKGSIGAQVLGSNPAKLAETAAQKTGPFVPATIDAFDDFDWGCKTTSVPQTKVDRCVSQVDAPRGSVVVIGDSHAQEWLPAIRAAAVKFQWNLTILIKQGCPYTDAIVARESAEFKECTAWNREVRPLLAAMTPDLVITASLERSEVVESGHLVTGTEASSDLTDGYVSAWSRLTERGIPVVVLRDTPRMPFNIPECIEKNGEANLAACSVARTVAISNRPRTAQGAQAKVQGSYMIDMNDFICPGTTCWPVIGGVLVYRDTDHLTATYVRSMSRVFEDRLQQLPSVASLLGKG